MQCQTWHKPHLPIWTQLLRLNAAIVRYKDWQRCTATTRKHVKFVMVDSDGNEKQSQCWEHNLTRFNIVSCPAGPLVPTLISCRAPCSLSCNSWRSCSIFCWSCCDCWMACRLSSVSCCSRPAMVSSLWASSSFNPSASAETGPCPVRTRSQHSRDSPSQMYQHHPQQGMHQPCL